MPPHPVTADIYEYETSCRTRTINVIAGVDEAGRGPLAGPVVAAAVSLPSHLRLEGLNDSKQIRPVVRERLYQDLTSNPDISYSIGVVEIEDIDRINILRATHLAMKTAVEGLQCPVDLILVDGLPVPGLPFPSKNIVKGDSKCACIAAASILAKVHRDRIMFDLDIQFPGYGFAAHKGYGTRKHLAALEKLGPCPAHRRSFAPVAKIADSNQRPNGFLSGLR